MTATAPDAVLAAIRAGLHDRLRAEGERQPERLASILAFDAAWAVLGVGYEFRPAPRPLPAAPTIPARRREVLILAAAGLRNPEIGARLGLAEDTVKTHLRLLSKEFGAHGRTQLVFWAQALGVITLGEIVQAAQGGATP